MQSIALPYRIVTNRSELGHIGVAHRHSRTINRPVVVGLTRDVLRGEA
jgi:hypothetical protein